jgi:hypothetical protein
MTDKDPSQLEEVKLATEDMRLPPGSAVIQCILTAGAFSVRTILVGTVPNETPTFDPLNVAHRFANAVFQRMEEIMAEVNGGGAVYTSSAAEIEMQIGGDDSALQRAIAQVEAGGIAEFGSLPPSGVVAAPDAKPYDPEFDGRADVSEALAGGPLTDNITGEFHLKLPPDTYADVALKLSDTDERLPPEHPASKESMAAAALKKGNADFTDAEEPKPE